MSVRPARIRRVLSAGAATAALALTYTVGTATGSAPALAQSAPVAAPAGVTVAGLGTVSGTPDVLRMSLRVVVIRPDVTTALRDANTVTGRIRTSLRNNGVAAEDLQTTQLQVNPSYGGKPSKLIGYQVVQGLAAQLRKLDSAGKTVTDAITVGGTYVRFDGVSFVLSDDSPLKVKARERAFVQAKAKAEEYAKLSGRTLGPVESINEDVQQNYYDEFGRNGTFATGAASSDSAAGPVSFDPGTQRVDVRVSVRFAIA